MAVIQDSGFTATAADFSYPEHTPRWSPLGICTVCGQIRLPVTEPVNDSVNDMGGQDPFPKFGADEFLTTDW